MIARLLCQLLGHRREISYIRPFREATCSRCGAQVVR